MWDILREIVQSGIIGGLVAAQILGHLWLEKRFREPRPANLEPAPSDCATGQHDKCYSMTVLLTDPPIYPWICRRCKARGTDPAVSLFSLWDEYSRLDAEAPKAT